MPQNHESEDVLREFLRALFRHRRKTTLIFLVAVLGVSVWVVLKPKTYRSTAKLYLRPGIESVTLDPTATTGETVNIHPTHQSQINSTLEILNSRGVAERVVDDLGVELVLEGQKDEQPGAGGKSVSREVGVPLRNLMSQLSAWKSNLSSLISEPIAETERSRAIRKVLLQTECTSPRDTSVLVIDCKANHPRLAQQIAESWTSEFLQENLRLARTARSFEFFEKQVATLNGELQKKDLELQRMKDESGIVTVEGQRSLLEQQIGTLRGDLFRNESSLAMSKTKIQELETRLGSSATEHDDQAMNGVSDDSFERMRERFYELQIQERQLKARFHAQHPQVVAVEKQRKEVERLLESQPVTRLLEQSLMDERFMLASLQAEQEVLRQGDLSLRKDLLALNNDARRIMDLERQIASLEVNYQTHAEAMEQARIRGMLETEQISSVNVMQVASYEVDPVGLRTALSLLLGVLGAGLAALSAAVVFGYFDRTFLTASQVEETLEVPVLCSVSRSRSPQVRVS